MTHDQLLNAVGLGSGIVGVLIIFRYRPPQPDFRLGNFLLLESDEGNEEKLHARRKHTIRSAIGLSFVLVGFLFQLAAVFVQSNERSQHEVCDSNTQRKA